MPMCEPVQKRLYNRIMLSREKPFENRYGALGKRSAMHASRRSNETNLQNIFKVSCSELFHFRRVIGESANDTVAVRWNLAKSEFNVISSIHEKRRTTNLWSRDATRLSPPGSAYSRRMRCVNNAFHVPSSHSCIKSTTSMRKASSPSGPSFSVNAFCSRIRY